MAIRGMRKMVPRPWKAHSAPTAMPRYRLNQRVTPETRRIWNTVVAMPSRMPKYR
jgi:hypothetical protein